MKRLLRRLRCLFRGHRFKPASIINRVFETGSVRTSVLLRCECGEVKYL